MVAEVARDHVVPAPARSIFAPLRSGPRFQKLAAWNAQTPVAL